MKEGEGPSLVELDLLVGITLVREEEMSERAFFPFLLPAVEDDHLFYPRVNNGVPKNWRLNTCTLLGETNKSINVGMSLEIFYQN